MQQKILNLLLFSVFIGCWIANPADSLAQQWARKMFKEFQHDFGTITKESRPEHRFEIENVYKEDIRIQGVFSSCGCTSVSVTKRVLKTYEKAYVVCRFNSHIVDGVKQATVTVRFDSPFVGEAQLVVSGNVVRGSGVKVSTRQIDFGQVVTGQASERVVQLSRQGDPTFQITDVVSTFPHIGVSLNEKYRGRDVVTYEIVVRLKKSVPTGYLQGELFIIGKDRSQRIKVPINFTAKVVAAIQISPGILTLSPVRPGEEITKKVVVKADQPFRITDVTCHSSAFRVRADGMNKKVHFVEISYVGEDDPGHHECFLTFQTNLGGESTARVKAIVDIVQDAESTTTSDAAVSQNELGQ